MARALVMANMTDSSSSSDEDDDFDDRSNHLRVLRRSIRDASNPFAMPAVQFAQTYRFVQNEVMEIIDLIRPHIRETLRITSLPLELKVKIYYQCLV